MSDMTQPDRGFAVHFVPQVVNALTEGDIFAQSVNRKERFAIRHEDVFDDRHVDQDAAEPTPRDFEGVLRIIVSHIL